MNYLVSGGAGFIGSHLCEELALLNHNVLAVDDLSTGFETNLPISNNIELIRCKLQVLSESYYKNLDGIFHLAAQASVPISIKDFFSSTLNNLESTIKVFDIARRYRIPVVYASSSAIYGNLPLGDDNLNKFEILSPYAQDKLTMENYARLCHNIYNVGSIGLRFFNVYGPKQDPLSPYSGVISIFIDKFIRHQKITINGGYQTRDFIYVKDIVKTLIESMSYLHENSDCLNLNVGTGKEISINILFELLCEIYKYRPEVEYMPLDKSDPERSSGTFSSINEELNINISDFITFELGIKETVGYYNNVYNYEEI